MLNTSVTDPLKASLPDLEAIAKESGFIKYRSQKFCAFSFVAALLQTLRKPEPSLNQFATILHKLNPKAMTRQAVHHRFNPRALEFLAQIHASLLAAQYPVRKDSRLRSSFRRILIQDCSTLSLCSSLHDHFPACNNQHGKTAGVKVSALIDLMEAKMIHQEFDDARCSDKDFGKRAIPFFDEADLILRDLGFFALAEFRTMNSRGVHWVSRITMSQRIYIDGVEIEKLLRTLNGKEGKSYDLKGVISSGKNALDARVLVTRVPKEVAEKRREKRRETARRNPGRQNEPSARSLYLDSWNIIVTNVSVDLASGDELMDLYRVRWQIEIQFRGWKQAIRPKMLLSHRTGECHTEILIYGCLIAQILMMRAARKLLEVEDVFRLSWEKVAKGVMDHLEGIREWTEVDSFAPDPRHIHQESRNRAGLIESMKLLKS